MSEYKCLKIVRDNGPLEYTALLNLYKTKAHTGFMLPKARIHDLLEKGYLEGIPQAKQNISISHSGRIRLDDLNAERFRYWYPIIATNILSIIAIIVSVIALLK